MVLITNQSGIARGLVSRETVDRIHEKLSAELASEGAHLDGIYLCPHLPREELEEGQQACSCRKPQTGLVERAMRELHLEGLSSIVVGDKMSDLELARRIPSRSVLVLTGEGRATRDALENSPVKADHRERRSKDGGGVDHPDPGAFSMNAEPGTSVRRILVTRLRYLGDVVSEHASAG